MKQRFPLIVVLFAALLFLTVGFLIGRWWGKRGTIPQQASMVHQERAPSVKGSFPVLEIHSKHFLYGYPLGVPAYSDLIIRDIYALSANDSTRMADWVAYRLERWMLKGNRRLNRVWRADPWLEEDERLEPEDYRGASRTLRMDRGHLAPLASFPGTRSWQESNYLSNIAPQKADLNQGPWRMLEEAERDLLRYVEPIYVITGPLYERPMPLLPGADEPHRVPSGFWKIILVPQKPLPDSLLAFAFIFDQETGRREHFLDHLVSINEVERRSGLDFLHELPDTLEERIEGTVDMRAARRYLLRHR